MKLTIEQKNKLHELAFASATNREIAEQLGLPISEVYAQRSQMGITRDKVALAKGEAPRTVMAKHVPVKRAKKPTYTFDIVEMATSCNQAGKSEEQVKVDFCDLLLKQFTKMKGEDLAPHLSEFVFDRRERCSHLHFRF